MVRRVTFINQALAKWKLNKENHQEAPEFNSDLYRTSNRHKKTYAGNPSSSRHGETKSRRLYNIELLNSIE
jgi:hypothetical protein